MCKKKYGKVRIWLFNGQQMIDCFLLIIVFVGLIKIYIFLTSPSNKDAIENAAIVIIIGLSFYLLSPSIERPNLFGKWYNRFLQPGDTVKFGYPIDMISSPADLINKVTEGEIESLSSVTKSASLIVDNETIQLPLDYISKIRGIA